MCLKWWKRSRHGDQRRMQMPSKDGDDDDDDATTSSSNSRVSALLSSKDLFSTSSTTSGSFAGGFIKDLLPQGPLFYKRSEIVAATLNFSPSQQIGSSTWKGVLRGSQVAIVRKPGVPKNFYKLLRNVHTLHHRNLVKVMGGCPSADCVFVVYEFVHGDSLQACLCSTLVPGYTVLSTWKLRMQVAVDVAKGLEYAHQQTNSHSAHKYLTSSNVLLMKETLRAKLALVGMSALTGEVDATIDADYMPHKETRSHTRLNKDTGACKQQEGDVSEVRKNLSRSRSLKIKGTHGYMPPEYLLSGVVLQEYDVFTYGIVLLELLKGQEVGARKGRTIRKASLVDEVRAMMTDTNSKGRLRLWIDGRLNDSYPVEDAVKVVVLALSCVDENPQKRPRMSKVALEVAVLLDSAEKWERGRSTMTGTGTLEGR